MISWVYKKLGRPTWGKYVLPGIPLALILAVVASMTLCSREAEAKVQVEFKLLPTGHALTLNDGIKVRYYKLHEFLELATFDKELVKLRTDFQDLGDLNNKLKIQLDVLEFKLIPTLESDKEILRKRGVRLDEKWEKCEEARVKAEGGPIWPYVVGIAGVVVGAVGTGMYLAEKMSDR